MELFEIIVRSRELLARFSKAFGEYDSVMFCKKRLDPAISADSAKGSIVDWIYQQE